MLLRVSKTILVAIVAAFALLVTWNNIVDYGSNFEFVQHVLKMDTTFEGNKLMERAVETPTLHHLGYWLIILLEAITGTLCAWGALAMARELRTDRAQFERAKVAATAGLTVGVTLWFGGFIVVGAEWFLMWQSETWNGAPSAFRFAALLLLTLIFLHQSEPDT